MTPAPTLNTTRLTLRGPVKDDLAPMIRFLTGSERMAALGGQITEPEAWRGFIAGIGHWQWFGYGFFTVTDSTAGTALGRVGILNHLGWPQPELAWHLFDGSEGRGIAYEAAVAVRQWFGTTHSSTPLISLIAPDNTRSAALAARLGATPGDTTTATGSRAVIHTHLPHDAPLAQAQYVEVRAC